MKFPTEGKAVIQFGAPWCKPCANIKPVIEALAIEHDAEFIYVNSDNEPTLASEMNVRSLPTVIVMIDGEEKARAIGASPNQIKTAIVNGLN